MWQRAASNDVAKIVLRYGIHKNMGNTSYVDNQIFLRLSFKSKQGRPTFVASFSVYSTFNNPKDLSKSWSEAALQACGFHIEFYSSGCSWTKSVLAVAGSRKQDRIILLSIEPTSWYQRVHHSGRFAPLALSCGRITPLITVSIMGASIPNNSNYHKDLCQCSSTPGIGSPIQSRWWLLGSKTWWYFQFHIQYQEPKC